MAWPLAGYPSFLLLAIVAGAGCAAALLRRQGVAVGRIAVVLALAALAALTGAKVFSWVERGAAGWPEGWELVQGYRYPGGILALVAVAPLLRRCLPERVTLLGLGDALAAATALAMAVVRVGCHVAGCCHGVVTEVPWAVRFAMSTPAWHAHVDRGWIGATAPHSLAVHPLQLYFALSSLALAVVLLRRRRRPGVTMCLFLCADGLLKLLLEQLRLEYRPPLVWAAAAFALAGGLGLAALRVSRGGGVRA